MQDQLIICPRCTSNACYETKQEDVTLWHCFGCGFHSNSNRPIGELKTIQQGLPEIYKELTYIDENGLVWIPSVINIPNKGMVFVEGVSPSNWKWAAVCSIEITKADRKKGKYPKEETHRMDMTTIHRFDERDYMEALDYIGYYNK